MTPGLIARAAVKTVGLYVIGYLFFLPFQQSYESFSSPTPTPSPAPAIRPVLWRYLGIHGFFILVIMGFLFWRLRLRPPPKDEDDAPSPAQPDPVPVRRGRSLARPRGGADLEKRPRLRAPRYWPWLLAAAGVRYRGPPSSGWPAWRPSSSSAPCSWPLAPLVWRAIRSEDTGAPVGLFVYLLVATPLAIGIAVDIWELNISTGRMNTVFKLYLQAWVLMALASAFHPLAHCGSA